MGRNLAFRNELTREIAQNAGDLLGRVNGLLLALDIDQVTVTSGWRPPSINQRVKGAARKSYHMLGKAVDLLDDKEQSLAAKILSQPTLLREFGLWMEHPEHTRGKHTNWVHLDTGIRSEREVRVFRPFA